MHVKKENRHPFRGLRHSLIGEPDEVAQYEKEVAEQIETDKREEALDKGMEGLARKKKK